MSLKKIAEELIQMHEEDMRVRNRLAADGSLFQGYHPEMESVHRRNAARLRQIIEEHGWPGRTLVGEEAAHAAWIILQHSIGEPEFMRRGFRLVQIAAAAGEIDPKLAAMLEDRICVFEGRPQKFGTQFDWDENGQMSPNKYDDLRLVEERRCAIGLTPLKEAVDDIRAAMVRSGERPPADYMKRLREMDNWARRVGWRS